MRRTLYSTWALAAVAVLAAGTAWGQQSAYNWSNSPVYDPNFRPVDYHQTSAARTPVLDVQTPPTGPQSTAQPPVAPVTSGVSHINVDTRLGTRYHSYQSGSCDDGCCDAACCDASDCCETCDECPGCTDAGCETCLGRKCVDPKAPYPYFDCVKEWGGFVGGAELLYVKAHRSEGIATPSVLLVDQFPAEFDYEPAARAWIGYVQGDGLGYQLRYFNYNHGTSQTLPAPLAGATGTLTYDTYVIDAEWTDTRRIADKWLLQVSGGFRYVEFEESVNVIAPAMPPVAHQLHFDGFGVVAGAELQRDVRSWLSLYVRSRGAIVMGDETETFTAPMADVSETERDDVKWMLETQIGAELHVDTVGGARLFARGGIELQYWDGFTGSSGRLPVFPLTAPASDGAFGLGGFAASVGLSR